MFVIIDFRRTIAVSMFSILLSIISWAGEWACNPPNNCGASALGLHSIERHLRLLRNHQGWSNGEHRAITMQFPFLETSCRRSCAQQSLMLHV